MIVTSPMFANGARLPFECSYESKNRSPALSWCEPPLGVESFALVCQDRAGPTGRPWTHWLLWNIPKTETRLVAGLPQYPRLDSGAEQGFNDYLEYGWGGPCPPHGVHVYSFTLYAVDTVLAPTAPTIEAVLSSMAGRVVASARIEASYGAVVAPASLVAVGHNTKTAYPRSA